MSAWPDPASSRAVLIGTSRYTSLESLPAVANNLPVLARALMSSEVWNLAGKDCTVVAEPPTAADVLDVVLMAAEAARDTLLVYFAGHGLPDTRGELFLGLRDSRPGLGHTGIPYQALRDIIVTRGRAQRYVVVLDCCFSGRALGLMSGAESLAIQTEIDGSFLLAAAHENGTALAPPGESYTAFTGELLKILTEGIKGGPRELDMETVFRSLQSALRAKGRPLPQKRDRNTAGRLLLTRNVAYRPTASPSRVGDARWPSPVDVRTPQEFIGALAEVRVISGMTIKAVSERAVPPISGGAISNLLNRSTLPTSWQTTGAFLVACGVSEEEVRQWRSTWERLRAADAAETATLSVERDAAVPRAWRWRLRSRRKGARPQGH